MQLIDALNWRYAAKRMNGQAVPDETVDTIVEAARLAPSSYGLQPYTVQVVKDPALRAAIQQKAAPQPQLTEGSHLLVFAAWNRITDREVDRFIELIARERNQSRDELKGYADTIKGTVNGLATDTEKGHWAARQAYLGLGMALAAAAMARVDATPMEGFDPHALDQVLGLPEQGLHSVVIATLGYRDTVQDTLATAKKVRWPLAQFRQQVG
ncbi:nitroreductase family protein [Marinobacter sp. M1N3S26]|uniref:nitroreductase family protein n=1 Tax=unclassified Marinobacter TaxID=83889 RepID=UPI00387AAF75